MYIKIDKIKIKLVYHNIKNIWSDETTVQNNKDSPFKTKKKKLLLNEYYTNRIKKRRSIDHFDNTLNSNRKKSKFENNFFLREFKPKKIQFSFPVTKQTPKAKNNFYLNNVYFGFEKENIEMNKDQLINTQKYREHDLSKIHYVEGKDIYNKLNINNENYFENFNNKAIDAILKQQKKLLLNSTINNGKLFHKKKIKILITLMIIIH
jgi:hypothetical protein